MKTSRSRWRAHHATQASDRRQAWAHRGATAVGKETTPQRAGSRHGAIRATALAVIPVAGVLAAVGGATPALAGLRPPAGQSPGLSCTNATCTVSPFTTPGTGQQFRVPFEVGDALSVTLYGAVGAANGTSDDPGGDGAQVTASLAVSRGATIGVDVGGAGQPSTGFEQGGQGGVNGGGSSSEDGGGGGGATDVTSSGTRLLVAGGGGGAGDDAGNTEECMGSVGNPPSSGGAGGDADSAGEAGQAITAIGTETGQYSVGSGGGGNGGTSSGLGSGGAAGVITGTAPCSVEEQLPGEPGTNGSAGQGGDGNTSGGGGGGYLGGGAGGEPAKALFSGGDTIAGAGGGGGGSSYTGGAGVSGATVDDAGNSGQVNDGNGEALISYPNPVVPGTPSYSTAAGQVLNVSEATGLVAAASAPAGDPLMAQGLSTTTAQGGTVTVRPDGSFTYTPPAGFTGGTDSFSYLLTAPTGEYATGTATISVGQPIPQTVTFTSTPPSPGVAGRGLYSPHATGGGSGNPVTFAIDPDSTTGACSINNVTVSFTGPGDCIVDATQAGGDGYAAGQASQSITVDQPPVFVVEDPPLTVAAGQAYGYTFVASGTPAPSYALLAGAPSWLTINASTGVVSGTPPSGTTSFSYQLTATNPAGTDNTRPFTVTVTATPKANLAAALSCPHTLTVAGTGTCTLTVTNHGPDTATGVVAEISLPAKLTKASCSPHCTRSHNVFTWKLATLAPGAAPATYTLDVKAAKTGQAAVTAAVDSTTADPHPGNNLATATITVKK